MDILQRRCVASPAVAGVATLMATRRSHTRSLASQAKLCVCVCVSVFMCEGMRAHTRADIRAIICSLFNLYIYIYIYITADRQLKYLRRDTPSLSLVPSRLHFPLFPSFVIRPLCLSDGTIDPDDIEKIFIAVNAIMERARGLI